MQLCLSETPGHFVRLGMNPNFEMSQALLMRRWLQSERVSAFQSCTPSKSYTGAALQDRFFLQSQMTQNYLS